MKHRPLKTFENAITAILGALTPDGCADAVSKSASLCYKWGDVDSEALPNLKQALAMDVAFVREGHGKPPILCMYETLLDAQTEGAKASPAVCMKDGVLHVHHRVGELSASVLDAIHPSGDGGARITHNERVVLEKHISEIRAMCDVMEAAVQQASAPMHAQHPKATEA